MPELPEVETVRAGLCSLLGPKPVIERARIYQRQLRYPVPSNFSSKLRGKTIQDIQRRAKYLLFDCGDGFIINHLGMTGSWRQLGDQEKRDKHDHCIITLDDGRQLAYRDPRRFGMLDWWRDDPAAHPRICDLGPEPLDQKTFQKDYLHAACQKRKASIKAVIMDQKVVVGVGNIYASESLYRAGIHPKRSANKISKPRLERLVQCIREILGDAIAAGGSTISDFRQAGGSSGYFQHQFQVYERAGEPCHICGKAISQAVIGQRSSYWCNKCQH